MITPPMDSLSFSLCINAVGGVSKSRWFHLCSSAAVVKGLRLPASLEDCHTPLRSDRVRSIARPSDAARIAAGRRNGGRGARTGRGGDGEIDTRAEAGGAAASCPRCGGGERVRWGRTRTGAQRWRCSGCGASWSGRSGTPIARVHRPDLMAALARDMVEAPQPLSYRRAAHALGISRHTAWRWRMTIIGALPPEPEAALAGIVEADEAHQRESRKGSQEWVRHRRDPKNHPAPQVCATAPALAGLQASWRVGDSAAGRLARLGPKTPCGDGPRRASRLRGHCGCGSGGDLGPTAAGNGARCGALHGRSRDLRADRQGPTHPILRAQRRTALEVHPA